MANEKQIRISSCRAVISGLRNKRFNYDAALIIISNLKLRVQAKELSWDDLGTSETELNTLLNLLEARGTISQETKTGSE